MSKELKKTIAFAAVAAGLLAITVVATRPRVTTAEAFNDQGEGFFPQFTDPRTASALEVIDYDPATASALPFKVEYSKGKGWVIPSHHEYPADAKDRLAKTAAGVIDLKKDVVVSDRADQHEELGVLDPLDAKTTSLQGRGKRVAIKDGTGKVLADFIIGKPVPGRTNQKFVRVPGQKRTYGVNVDVDLTARFADWIETNLLKLDTGHVTKITIDNHTVDPEQGTVTPGDVVKLERKTSTSPWTMEEVGAGKELDTAKVTSLTTALGDVKIVGIRPKPAGLTSELKSSASDEGSVALSRQSLQSLASRGFYMTRDGRLLSNQGDIYITTDEGIVYILRFGEITVATGEALTAGAGEETPEKKKDESEKKAGGTGDNRFLFVTVQFEPELIAKPETLVKAGEVAGELPKVAFARTPEQAKSDEEKAKREKEEYERKIEEGKVKAKELTERFAGWYYVVPGDAFRNIVLNRDGLSKVPGAPSANPGGVNLPPGMNLPGD